MFRNDHTASNNSKLSNTVVCIDFYFVTNCPVPGIKSVPPGTAIKFGNHYTIGVV